LEALPRISEPGESVLFEALSSLYISTIQPSYKVPNLKPLKRRMRILLTYWLNASLGTIDQTHSLSPHGACTTSCCVRIFNCPTPEGLARLSRSIFCSWCRGKRLHYGIYPAACGCSHLRIQARRRGLRMSSSTLARFYRRLALKEKREEPKQSITLRS